MSDPKELFNDYLDGGLSDARLRELEAWLAADERHADAFFEFISLHSWTFEALRSSSLEQVLAGPAELARRRMLAQDGRARRVARRWLPWTAAAALVGVLCGAWLLSRPDGEKQQAAADPAIPAPLVAPEEDLPANERSENPTSGGYIAATVTRLDNCVWHDDFSALQYGQQLKRRSRVHLQSGVVRLTFESGAEALLQGPCDFVVDNAMHGTIYSGRLSVKAPSRAYGFRIRTPNAEVIDLGTEFGVSVNDGGEAEVHVFDGEVLSRRLDEAGEQQGDLVLLKANDGLKYGSPRQSPSRIASNTNLFVRRSTLDIHPKGRRQLPVGDGLALWLAADLSVRTQQKDSVVAWSDILFGDNVSAEDALQPTKSAQPFLAPRAINGQPAVRFNGTSTYLVTTPLETTNDQTVFLVCQFSQRAARPNRKRGGQLLNYNGPPHRLVSSTYEPGVLQIGEPVGRSFAPTRLGGKLFSGRLNGRDVSEAIMYSDPIGPNEPVILAYRYDLANHRANLWLNGRLVDETPALRPAGVTSRKVIGRHGFLKYFFDGDIGELLIYNGALPDEQLHQVTAYLAAKFHIEATGASLEP